MYRVVSGDIDPTVDPVSGNPEYELWNSDQYCNDYGAGSSGDYYSLDSCVEFVANQGGKYFHYNEDYSECYVCASDEFSNSSAGTNVYRMIESSGSNDTAAGYKLYSDDMYCNDYGAGGSGDYYDLDSCVEFVQSEGGKYFHYNSDYSECYVCGSE